MPSFSDTSAAVKRAQKLAILTVSAWSGAATHILRTA